MNALVAQMIDFVGPLPEEWQAKWTQLQVTSNFVPVESMLRLTTNSMSEGQKSIFLQANE